MGNCRGLGRAASDDDVDFVAQLQQTLGVGPSPLFAAAACRIELLQDQADSHGIWPRLRVEL